MELFYLFKFGEIFGTRLGQNSSFAQFFVMQKKVHEKFTHILLPLRIFQVFAGMN